MKRAEIRYHTINMEIDISEGRIFLNYMVKKDKFGRGSMIINRRANLKVSCSYSHSIKTG